MANALAQVRTSGFSSGRADHPGLLTRALGAIIRRCFFAVFGPPD
jgi:hypothetical protein